MNISKYIHFIIYSSTVEEIKNLQENKNIKTDCEMPRRSNHL